jgi:hypothetical protein
MSLKGLYVDDSAEVAHHKVYSNCLRGFIRKIYVNGYIKYRLLDLMVRYTTGLLILLVMGEGLPRCEQWYNPRVRIEERR